MTISINDNEVLKGKLSNMYDGYLFESGVSSFGYHLSLIKHFEEELTKLQKKKPFKFQKKKLQLYNTELEELEKKINELYERLNEDNQFLEQKSNSIITTNSTKLNEKKKIA